MYAYISIQGISTQNTYYIYTVVGQSMGLCRDIGSVEKVQLGLSTKKHAGFKWLFWHCKKLSSCLQFLARSDITTYGSCILIHLQTPQMMSN